MTFRYFLSVPDFLDDDRILLFQGQQLLTHEGSIFWRPAELPRYLLGPGHQLIVRHDEVGRVLALRLEPQPATDGECLTLRQILLERDHEEFQLAGLGNQLISWYNSHRFCGSCGQSTQPHRDERALVCADCELSFYPRINPCVIVLVNDGDRILLAKNKRYAGSFYSCLAGFIEAGETPEETVRREVREEVGVELANIRYVRSQSWPFPSQLMLGYFADYAGGELRPDPEEIADARWFAMNELPVVPKAKISVAGQLIELYRQQCLGASATAGM